MRGYFAVGTDGLSKPMNLGNLLRIAHAFGASFFFTVAGRVKLADAMSDTSDAASHLPIYQFGAADDLRLPQGCELVGVEITDDAVELPSFRHPLRAAYVFGSERLSLSAPVLARCRHVVKIPTRFSINVGMAGAIVMYDRMLTLGRFGERPLRAGGPAEAAIPARAAWGAPVMRRGGATPK
ncbi:MAG TPA: RNA methyltransferase [Micropepsaceae bacterium]|nr:RNA methyltransferase [Micropepsaceae bacterium]